jgi:23S rRNA (adenine2503-C2)-methyltransferase
MELILHKIDEYLYKNNEKRIDEDNFIPKRDVKLLLKTRDEYLIESAFYEIIKDKKEVLHSCISTQIGCNNKCIFCHSGEFGLVRNLNSDEIENQISQISFNSKFRIIDDIAVMGIGEPLDNILNVANAINKSRENGLLLGVVRISTSGNIKGINRLNYILPNVKLWISLHSANEMKRKILMPKAHVTTINELIKAASNYAERTNSTVILQYLIFKDFNDSIDDINELAQLLKGKEELFKIQFAIPNGEAAKKWKTKIEDARSFYEKFIELSSVKCKIFLSKGLEVKAGCGELSISKYFI